MSKLRSTSSATNGFAVQKRWFEDALKARGLSGRKISAVLGMDPPAWSRVLSGQRRMTIPEAMALAKALRVPPDEVMERLGVEVAPDPLKGVPMRYTIGAGGVIKAKGRGDFVERVAAPPGLHGDAEGGVIDMGAAGHAMQGAKLFWQPAEDGVGVESVGRICLVEMMGGEKIIGVITRWSKKGRWHVRALDELGPGNKRVNVIIVKSAPVVWVGL